MKTRSIPVAGNTTLCVRDVGEGRPLLFVPG